ncbi:MAG TPA: oxidoreductase [Natronoarchaeum rubrum]|nr:oxidoreductase [Natronoarchaeum rubrum]
MGLRCSLLGHSFGDSEVEREREEQGSEVVVTIREEQTCSRCGKTKLVSENKEVTSLAARESASEPANAATGEDAAASGGHASSAADSAPATGGAADDAADESFAAGDGRDAEIIDDGPDESVPEATREAASVAEDDGETASGSESPVDPEADPEDDAVILDESDEEDPEPGEREHGEWPDADDTRRSDDAEGSPQEWPDADGEDEGFDAEPTSGEPDDVEFGGGLTPEEASGTPDGDGQVVGSTDTGFTSANSAPSPVDADRERETTEYVCPECGHTAAGTGTSLRAGDICPECRRGYIAER